LESSFFFHPFQTLAGGKTVLDLTVPFPSMIASQGAGARVIILPLEVVGAAGPLPIGKCVFQYIIKLSFVPSVSWPVAVRHVLLPGIFFFLIVQSDHRASLCFFEIFFPFLS